MAKTRVLKEKNCPKCKQIKAIEDFSKDKHKASGFKSWCKICSSNHNKVWRKNNPEKVKNQYLKWGQSEKGKEYNKKWMQEHSTLIKERERKRSAKRRSTPKGKITSAIGNAIRHSLKENKGGNHWESIVGYTITDLIFHLEKYFTEGMTWNNYGDWHIDHKTPIAHFNFNTFNDTDFKKCWSLDNLQPLWARDNILKGTKERRIIYGQS